jgi:leader peptidase (prepilin peptidase)/N-methyltransferase
VDLFLLVLVIVSGLMLGSFFNVIIWRLPRGESIVFPGSHCPSCNHPIRPWENIPLLSFVLLRGKCAGCRAPIPWLFPAVEALTSCAAVILYYRFITPAVSQPPTAAGIVALVLQLSSLLVLVPVAVIDMRHYIIPDSITISGFILGVCASFLPGGLSPVQMLLGVAAGAATLYLLGVLGGAVFKKQDAMGGGDIKLMGFLGAVWGWRTALETIVFGSLLGTLVSLPLLFTKQLREDRRIPFGPFLALGAWASVLWGEAFIRAYFDFVNLLVRLMWPR